jgi:hypothetical protein
VAIGAREASLVDSLEEEDSNDSSDCIVVAIKGRK